MERERLVRAYQKIMALIARELQDLMSDQFLILARALRIDMAQFQSMAGGNAGADPYRIMGLDRSASDDEIEKRYHQLLRQLHPDTAGVPGTACLLQIVMAAYAMIRQERAR